MKYRPTNQQFSSMGRLQLRKGKHSFTRYHIMHLKPFSKQQSLRVPLTIYPKKDDYTNHNHLFCSGISSGLNEYSIIFSS